MDGNVFFDPCKIISDILLLCPNLNNTLNKEIGTDNEEMIDHFFYPGDKRILILQEIAYIFDNELKEYFTVKDDKEVVQRVAEFYSGSGFEIVNDEDAVQFINGHLETSKQYLIWDSIIDLLNTFCPDKNEPCRSKKCKALMYRMISNPLIKELSGVTIKRRLPMSLQSEKINIEEIEDEIIKIEEKVKALEEYNNCSSDTVLICEPLEELNIEYNVTEMDDMINKLKIMNESFKSKRLEKEPSLEYIETTSESDIRSLHEHCKDFSEFMNTWKEVGKQADEIIFQEADRTTQMK